MIFNQILLRLTEPQESYEKAVVLGRMCFLDWLMSLPPDGDFKAQAKAAYERAAPLKVVVPAVGVLCDLLIEATHEVPQEEQATRINRRRGGRRRRSLH